MWLLVVSAALLAPPPASAQLFFSSRPEPPFAIGPLMIRASVKEGVSPVSVNVLWSLVIPASARSTDVAQDLYLLWPGEVQDGGEPAKPDPGLVKLVEAHGFSIIGDGRLGLFALSVSDRSGGRPPEPQPGGASFVVFVQEGGTLGLSPPASLIRIPWTPRLADSAWLMDLRMKASGLVKPRKASWTERVFTGGHSQLTMSYNEVRDRPLFGMYMANRDRAVRLADAPAELVATFAQSDRLKIDQVFPPTAIRRVSETEESTEVVSLFVDKSEGITPQSLAVQFGYFSRFQAWELILIPALIFMIGQAIGPVLGRTGVRIANAIAARVHVGRWNGALPARESGVILSRATLAKIVPGETTQDEVIQLCGSDMEQYEQFPASDRRALVYRGRRLVPKGRRIFGWLSTVRHWEEERHEVRIELEGAVVRDVHAQIRYARVTAEEPATQ